MNYAQIKYFDVANGPGCRTSLFVSGCRHHCEGCFNKSLWDFDAGEKFSSIEVEKIMKSLSSDYVDGLTILGGEPFEPENQAEVLNLIQKVKTVYPNKSIWVYTGFLYEELIGFAQFPSRLPAENLNVQWEILNSIDVLVDGEFKIDLKNLKEPFKGSTNQRIIDVQKTLRTTEISTISYN